MIKKQGSRKFRLKIMGFKFNLDFLFFIANFIKISNNTLMETFEKLVSIKEKISPETLEDFFASLEPVTMKEMMGGRK